MKARTVTFACLLLSARLATAAELPGWMAGAWRGNFNGRSIEEHWTDGKGTLMVGMHREQGAGKPEFEFLRIETKGDSLVYLAMPYGKPATPFPLKSQTASRVVFENLEHDFPQRILYWRDGEKLCARAEGKIKGKDEGEEWCWVRFTQ